MEIEFDPEKAAANPLRHKGVTFEEAATVLRDPYALTHEDTDAQGEARMVTLGMGARGEYFGSRLDPARRKHPSDFRMEGQPTATQSL